MPSFYLLDIKPGYQKISLWECSDTAEPVRLSSLPTEIKPFQSNSDPGWGQDLLDFLARQSLKADIPFVVTLPSVYSDCLSLPAGLSAAQTQTVLLSEVEQLYLFQLTSPAVRWYELYQHSKPSEKQTSTLFFSAQPQPFVQELQRIFRRSPFLLEAVLEGDLVSIRAAISQNNTGGKRAVLLLSDQMVTLAQVDADGQWTSVEHTPFPAQMENPLSDIGPWVFRTLSKTMDMLSSDVSHELRGVVIDRTSVLRKEAMAELQAPFNVTERSLEWDWIDERPAYLMGNWLKQQFETPEIANNQAPLFYFYSTNPAHHPIHATQSLVKRYRNFIRAGLLLLNGITLFAFLMYSIFLGVVSQQTNSHIADRQIQIEQLHEQRSSYRETLQISNGLRSNIAMYNMLVYSAANWAEHYTATSGVYTWPSPLVSITATWSPDELRAVMLSGKKPSASFLNSLQGDLPKTQFSPPVYQLDCWQTHLKTPYTVNLESKEG